MNRLFFSAILFFAFIAAPPIARADQLGNDAVKWEPTLTTDDALFPALILATRNLDLKAILKAPSPPDYLGDRTGLFGIKIRAASDDAKIHVTITIDGLSDISEFDGVLPKADLEYTVMPYMRYKSDALWKVKQPYPTTAIFSVSVNGAPAEEMTEKISVRTVNDVPFSIERNGKRSDTSFLYAAFVNENAPVVDRILQDALAHNAVKNFVGYDGNDPQEVYRQIFAIWNTLQRKGVKYSNITTPSGFSKDIMSQHVRLADESFDNSQANCVDGSTLLASALYKIGMCPMLIIKPGHMFLGVYMDKNSCETKDFKNASFIETTLIGNIKPLNPLQKHWQFKTSDGYLASISYNSLLQAIDVGQETFNEMLPALQAHQSGYYILDIQRLRSLGVTPISSVNSVE